MNFTAISKSLILASVCFCSFALASATVKDNAITIKGLKAGKTTIAVTDSKKVTGMIGVTVK